MSVLIHVGNKKEIIKKETKFHFNNWHNNPLLKLTFGFYLSCSPTEAVHVYESQVSICYALYLRNRKSKRKFETDFLFQ
jgi:hypothetical protein